MREIQKKEKQNRIYVYTYSIYEYCRLCRRWDGWQPVATVQELCICRRKLKVPVALLAMRVRVGKSEIDR